MKSGPMAKWSAAGNPAVIARAFAVTEKSVYRRLALAGLPEPVIDALAANEINLSAAACFTISADEARTLEVLEKCRGDNWSDYQIKKALKPDAVKETDRRAKFVGIEAYQAAGAGSAATFSQRKPCSMIPTFSIRFSRIGWQKWQRATSATGGSGSR